MLAGGLLFVVGMTQYRPVRGENRAMPIRWRRIVGVLEVFVVARVLVCVRGWTDLSHFAGTGMHRILPILTDSPSQALVTNLTAVSSASR